jgi:hypothetical protein
MHHPGLGPSFLALAHLGLETIVVMIVGGCILALPFAIVSYYLSLSFFIKIRKSRREIHMLN